MNYLFIFNHQTLAFTSRWYWELKVIFITEIPPVDSGHSHVGAFSSIRHFILLTNYKYSSIFEQQVIFRKRAERKKVVLSRDFIIFSYLLLIIYFFKQTIKFIYLGYLHFCQAKIPAAGQLLSLHFTKLKANQS